MTSTLSATASSTAPTPTPDELLTVAELAAILKCPPDSVYNLTRKRTQARSEFPIPFLRLPIGLRFSREDVEEWIAAQRARARKLSEPSNEGDGGPNV